MAAGAAAPALRFVKPGLLQRATAAAPARYARTVVGPCQIEFARRGDAEAIAAMSRDLVEFGLGWGWQASRVRESIADRQCNAIVARVGVALAGFAIMRYGDNDAHLDLLAVDPAFRRRGIGRALLRWLEASARTAGIETIFLEARLANRAGRAFYAALGYRELARMPRYYAGSEDAVRVGKDLGVHRSRTP